MLWIVDATACDVGPPMFCTVTYTRLYLAMMTMFPVLVHLTSVLVIRRATCLRIRG